MAIQKDSNSKLRALILISMMVLGSACSPVHEDNSFDRDSTIASPTPDAPNEETDDDLDTIGIASETFQDLYTDIFAMTCTRCHGDNPDLVDEPPQGLNFDDFATVSTRIDLADPTASLLHNATDPDGDLQMPRGGLTPLTTMERARVLAWIQDGAPQN